MSTNFEFHTASYSSAELKSYFSDALGLAPVGQGPDSPAANETWWAGSADLGVDEFEDEGSRLEATGTFASISFEPRKDASWEATTEGLAAILGLVLDLLRRRSDSSGLFVFYEENIVLEKRRTGQIVIDRRLVDRNDFDDLGVFAKLFEGYPVISIPQS